MSVTTVADKKPLSMLFNMHASFRIQSLCKNSGNDVEGCRVADFASEKGCHGSTSVSWIVWDLFEKSSI